MCSFVLYSVLIVHYCRVVIQGIIKTCLIMQSIDWWTHSCSVNRASTMVCVREREQEKAKYPLTSCIPSMSISSVFWNVLTLDYSLVLLGFQRWKSRLNASSNILYVFKEVYQPEIKIPSLLIPKYNSYVFLSFVEHKRCFCFFKEYTLPVFSL